MTNRTNSTNKINKVSKVNKLNTPASKKAIENMKYEIAGELGVTLGADATARQNGTVGGEITKRLIQKAKNSLTYSKNKTTQTKSKK